MDLSKLTNTMQDEKPATQDDTAQPLIQSQQDTAQAELDKELAQFNAPQPPVAPPNAAPPAALAVAPEKPTTRNYNAFFLRKGTDLSIPLDVPGIGNYVAKFEYSLCEVDDKIAAVLRQELRRNAPLAAIIFEYDAKDETLLTIVAHHKAQARAQTGGARGVDTTVNGTGIVDFRDPSLYSNQPTGRYADSNIRGQQAQFNA